MPECQVDQVGNDRNRQILAEEKIGSSLPRLTQRTPL